MAKGLDPASDRPMYKQIADALRSRIANGDLAPGDRLPSEAQLMAEYGVAGGTVRQALALVRNEGLAVAEHGRGVFVRSRPRIRRLASDRFARRHREAGRAAYLAEAEAQGATASVDVYFVGRELANECTAQRLRLATGDPVLVRRRRYLSDGQPTELAISYVPWAFAAGTPMVEVNPGPGGIYARLEEQGHRLGRFTEEVSGRMPTAEEVQALQLAPATPVLDLVRVAYDLEGNPLEVCETVLASDRFILTYDLPAA